MATDPSSNSTEPETPWVVMRSKNDAPLIRATLEAVRDQDRPCRLLNIDSGSTDGTVDIIREYTDRLIQIRPEEYIPGRVLNRAMEETAGPVVVFLNSDATPQHQQWLSGLLEAMNDPKVAAVYGRQVARPDAWPLFARDTERAFGDGACAATWTHFFSMASSAIRRSVWEERQFDPDIRYSEDVEWTYWARKAGYAIRYAKDSVAMHSHNYTLAQSYRRHFGEGAADAHIFESPRLRASWLFHCALPAALEVARDAKYCLTAGTPSALLHSLALRPVQRWGHYRGYWSDKRRSS